MELASLAALGRERRSLSLGPSQSHHSESGRVSRADTEVEPVVKLSARDKAALVWLWSLSFLYGMMTDQLVSKVVDRPCGVREQLNTGLEVASVMAGLVLPFLLGTAAPRCLLLLIVTLKMKANK